MEHGCEHYRRRCSIRAPCCNEIFDCHHCHNEAKSHEIPRHQVEQVVCLLCRTEQEVSQNCIQCGVCMGKYFCGVCKLYEDDTSKEHYHCDRCGICRIGERDNFFHCDNCRCCYSILHKDNHHCVEGAMHCDCPICSELLFESRDNVMLLTCGHTIHQKCLVLMRENFRYACPVCAKSMYDMTKAWEKYDLEIAATPATPVPVAYQNDMVQIVCNDCGTISSGLPYQVAQKCPNCNSYNTRRT